MLHRRRFIPSVRSLENRLAPAVFTVTNLLNNGAGSLRSAILAANANLGADTVDFQSGLSGTISLTGGDIGITESVTIKGPGAKVIAVDGAGVGRIFTTKNAAANAQILVQSLTLSGGKDAGGGAIFGDDEILTIQECAITGNTSTTSGGGIYLQGNGRLVIFGSTLNNNSATVDGGAASVNGIASELYIYDCTVSGNTAGGDGGGVYTKISNGNALFFYNSTIASNNANRGGGFAMDPASVALASLDSCLIANNVAPSGPDLAGGSMLVDYTALTSKSGVLAFGGNAVTNALLGQNFKLGALADNGGNVLTHKPAIDSPVRDQGAPYSGSTYDNRGVGYPREINAVPDCGATECDPLFIVKNNGNLGFDSLRQQVIDANAFAGPNVITFDPTFFATAKTIKLSSEIAIDNPLTITGPTVGVTLSGENKVRIFNTSAAPGGSIITMNNLILTAGSTSGNGGAILTGSEIIHLTNCHVHSNSALIGGAMYFGSGSSFVIEGSTISGNTSTSDGGGIYFTGTGAGPVIRNSTFANNKANSSGAAIRLGNANNNLTIHNSTLTYNTAVSNGGAIDRQGGACIINLESTIVANNSAPSGPDIFSASIVNANFSAISSIANIGSFIGDATTNSLLGQNFKLGSLANNGGLTPTILPTVATSPLVNAGSNPGALINDQRGPGYGRVRGAAADIGAVEFPTTFVVTNTLSNGTGSLRQVVTDADAFAGPDTITFDAAIFSTPATITLGSAVAIDDEVEIQGKGANLTTINAAHNGRVFNTTGIPAGGKVVISGLRMINGDVPDEGGAIKIGDEIAFIVACEISGSTAATSGGAIEVNGGNLTIVDSTLANNSATGVNGGGLHFMGAGVLNVRNCTISGNKASTNNGGGVSLDNHTGTATFFNSTFTLNSSLTGGGIGRFAGSVTIGVESCIVSGNSAVTGADIATNGVVDAKTSLLGTVAATTFTKDAITTSLLGKSASLGTLANNGGPTQTHLPSSTSPVVNQGSNPFILANDQRGTGFPRSSQGGVDIGAIEANLPAHYTGVVIGDGTNQRSMVTQLKINFDKVVSFVGSPAAAFSVPRAAPLPITAVNLAASVDNSSGVTVVTLTFTGGSVDGKSLADGRYNLNILASQISGAGFDGNGDNIAGDNFSLVGSPANGLFRLFGDSDGDGTVAANDFIQFRLALGGSSSVFDFDGDGSVSANDFIQFRLRFGGSI